MGTWKKQKFGELINIKHGYAFKGEYFSDTPTANVLLTPGNFAIGGGFKKDKLKYYQGPIPGDYILRKGDLIVTMTDLSKKGDTLGYPAIVPNDAQFKYLHNQRVGLITSKNDAVDLEFLFYLMRTSSYQKFIVGSASGATVKHTSPKRIADYECNFPDVKVQSQIASLLSAYDDLIENNEKRIKALEEMAQLLYTEWFVKFKFPGHERVKMVDSGTEFGVIPEGWGVKNLSEKVQVKKGKNITRETVVNGSVPVVAGGLGPAYFHNQANTKGPVITVSASGANAGFIRLYFEDIWTSDCSFVDSNVTNNVYYYYLLLKNKQDMISGLQRGSAQPHVYPKDLMNLLILDMPESLIDKFEEKARITFGIVKVLEAVNKDLSQMRDLLIPQLVTGKRLLAVSNS